MIWPDGLRMVYDLDTLARASRVKLMCDQKAPDGPDHCCFE